MSMIYFRKWKLKPAKDSASNIPEDVILPEELEVNVPGDIYMHLYDAGIIDDPFYADNELGLSWIPQCDWEYTTDFHINNISDYNSLVFEGLDTIADVYLNDHHLTRTENMFVRYSVSVTDFLRTGRNTIKLIFYSPLKKAIQKRSDIRQLPSARHKDRVFIRKAQYSFGWDWGPAFPSMGIWKDIYLKNSALEINHIEFTTRAIEDKKATVQTKVILNSNPDQRISVSFRLFNEHQNFEQIVYAEDLTEISYVFEIDNPRLWWPRDQGHPYLYNLLISVSNSAGEELCVCHKKVGIRTIELRLQENGKNCFRFYINGKAIYLKGANWIPADTFLPRVTDEKYENLILAAQQANMNVLRVWGGGIYENDFFYEICDQAGILVWQDFMFACATYPDDNNFLANVKQEVTQNVQRLQHHPSLLIWCGNNENEWIWYRDKCGPVKEMQGYDFFHNTLPAWLKELDASRPFWPSSPFGDEEDPNSEQSGNRHAWDIWSFWIDYTEVKHDRSLFVTEFGFQAPATYETFKNALPVAALSPQNALFEFHNKQDEGSERLFRFLSGHLPVKTDLESFIYLTQLNQGLALKTCLEHWRSRWPETAGSIIWQINDCWPVSSWSLIDSENRRKHSYYFVKHSFKNILISITEKQEKIDISVLNDNPLDLKGELKIYIWDFLSGSGQQTKKMKLDVKASSKQQVSIWDKNELHNKCMIVTAVDNKGKQLARNFYTSKRWKHVVLPKDDYEIKVASKNKLILQAGTILFFLRIEHPEIEMADLTEVILPDETHEILTLSGELNQKTVDELQIRSLNNYLCEM